MSYVCFSWALLSALIALSASEISICMAALLLGSLAEDWFKVVSNPFWLSMAVWALPLNSSPDFKAV